MMTQKTPKNPKIFFCDICDFVSSNKKDYARHLLSLKHQNNANDDKKTPKNPTSYLCNCGKLYKYRQGLSSHKKKCPVILECFSNKENKTEGDILTLTNMVMDVVKQNQELTHQNQELTNKIVDICKLNHVHMNNNILTNNHITNNTINSNNKTFNLNVFLNETCKGAMNISEFVDSLQLQISDLENVGRVGYIEGISSIIVNNLNALDETERPIHCTDKKRETFYIKDEDKWEKEDSEKNKIKKVIKKIASKNQRLLPKFKELHPGCNYSDSKYADQYSKLVIEATGGIGNNETEQEEKIIKKIAKKVTIEKFE